MIKLLTLSFFIVFTLKANSHNHYTRTNSDFDFSNVNYYKDFKEINSIVSSPESPYFFDTLLKTFLTGPTKLNDNQIVALLYGGINHKGYQSSRLDSLEKNCFAEYESKNYKLAIALSKSCLNEFPLSIPALVVQFFAFSELNNKIESDIAFHKYNTLFSGMEASGKHKITHSQLGLVQYTSFHMAGVNVKITPLKNDRFNNQIFELEYWEKETFIIPSK